MKNGVEKGRLDAKLIPKVLIMSSYTWVYEVCLLAFFSMNTCNVMAWENRSLPWEMKLNGYTHLYRECRQDVYA